MASKIDLVDERKVSSEEAKRIADENDACYVEVSSKSGKNVDSLFFKIVNDMEVLSYYSPFFRSFHYNIFLIQANRVLRAESVDEASVTRPMLLSSDGAAEPSMALSLAKQFADCCRCSQSSCVIV